MGLSDVSAAIFVGTSVVTFAIMLYLGGLVASSITFGLVRIGNKPMMQDKVAREVATKQCSSSQRSPLF